MSTIIFQEIEKDLHTFLRRVDAGEAFILFRDDQPIAEIKPVSTERKQRPFGLAARLFQVPADFNQPLPEDI